ncbi:Uma2 family endonuclease [Spirosoma foliorum]|uniref:Uma2 family endonuclease n=1 Tax=Spirosoma foliorum TaxID=2710596 RepID=A0A7G5GMV3_9BACT|nr:Uma2 family endonuclease [Spirosoma foliorum]QMW00195.1 Uma2 family endonuclease [Spirosoma foliorum]
MATLTAPGPSSITSESKSISFRIPQITTSEDFYLFCQDNPSYKFERESDGLIIVMPNTGGKTGRKNSELTTDVTIWNRQTKLGEVFDSSTAFNLPDGSTRSPDVAWIHRERWDNLTEREQEQFPPICPDFVIELLSATDSLKTAKAKMEDVWIANGCRLAWLIDPKTETTYIFRANGEIQIVGFDKILSGEDVLVGFELKL